MQTIVVIPVYNEAQTIVSVLSCVSEYVDWIIAVDDGSRDETAKLMAEWAQSRPHVIVATLPQNRGMATALGRGMEIVRELERRAILDADDLVVHIDADGQHRPEYIPEVAAALLQRGLDVLLTRRDFSVYPRHKKIGNAFLSLYARIVSGFPYTDVECGFRILRVRVVVDLLAYYVGVRYSCAQEIAVITARRGWRIANDFPVQVHYYRAGARVRDGLTNVALSFVVLLRVWFHWRNAPTPLDTSTLFLKDITG